MDRFGSTLSGVLESTADPVPPDDVFDVLTARQRRRLLVTLHRVETPQSLSDIARSLASETGEPGSKTVDELRTLLYHWHIPDLADVGLVSYDPGENTVDLTEEGRTLVEALDR